jgi:hypothetical protein
MASSILPITKAHAPFTGGSATKSNYVPSILESTSGIQGEELNLAASKSDQSLRGGELLWLPKT